MTRLLGLEEIRAALADVDLVAAMEEAFVAYSEGRAIVPPVGELLLDAPKGEVHLKYGAVEGWDDYVVKIASGFAGFDPPGNGLVLLFDRAGGAPRAVLLDEGHLTDQRTAAAGAVAAKHLAPPQVERVGLLGTGVQARLQLDHLRGVTPCREVLAWGRDAARVDALLGDLDALGYRAAAAASPDEVGEACDLVVTTTATETPLLDAVRPGAHVTAMGSDTETKQELAADLVARADVLVVDSRSQAALRGEVARAAAAGRVRVEDALELGEVVAGRGGRTSPEQVTIADLTGVAVQDHAIARAVLAAG